MPAPLVESASARPTQIDHLAAVIASTVKRHSKTRSLSLNKNGAEIPRPHWSTASSLAAFPSMASWRMPFSVDVSTICSIVHPVEVSFRYGPIRVVVGTMWKLSKNPKAGFPLGAIQVEPEGLSDGGG